LIDKKKIFLYILLPVLLISFSPLALKAQGNTVRYYDPGKRFSFALYGTYISASELLENPKSANPFEKEATTRLNSGYGYGAELNYIPPVFESGLLFYLSVEYLKASSDELILRLSDGVNKASVNVKEKFTMIPVELGVKWLLPVSSDNFKIYIGGGGGLYLGDRTRTMQNLISTNIEKTPGFSLNILSGLEYYIARNLSANLELKFREASFDVASKFSSNFINVNGTQYSITNPFYTRFNVDGVRISAGFKYQF
jgi:opacity protein-like surface antigen